MEKSHHNKLTLQCTMIHAEQALDFSCYSNSTSIRSTDTALSSQELLSSVVSFNHAPTVGPTQPYRARAAAAGLPLPSVRRRTRVLAAAAPSA